MEYKDLKISSLVERCVVRDPLAWAEFVRRFSSLITFSIKRCLSDYFTGSGITHEEIKDIKQNILVALWKENKLAEIKNRDTINYWLVVTARNTAINYLKVKTKEVLLSDDGYFEKLPAQEPGAETGKEKIEDAGEKIKKFYGLLTPREKLIFKFYFKKKLSLKDIAGIIGVPLGTVSSAVTRMRKKICSKS